jgi:hypothetical protein
MRLSRQAALLLAHYGVRCACLHVRQSLETLPGLAPACAASADALSAALRAVEAGAAADHPNQAALRRVLLSAATLQPVRMAACRKPAACCHEAGKAGVGTPTRRQRRSWAQRLLHLCHCIGGGYTP